VIDPELAQTNCSFRCQHLLGLDLGAIHPPQPQNCYVDFLPSSWTTPVRGAHHGRGVRYYALYSVHMGVPVQRKDVSHKALSITSGCIYWKDVVPNRMSYAGRVRSN
jgi:hypothetical protein